MKECSEHPKEQIKSFCINPCKTFLCLNCKEKHDKHEVKSLDDIASELRNHLEYSKKEKRAEQIFYGYQIEAIDRLEADAKNFLKSQLEEEKRMEEIIIEPLKGIINGFQEKVNTFLTSLKTKKKSCEIIEEQIYNQTKALDKEITSFESSIKNKDYSSICKNWIEYKKGNTKFTVNSDKDPLLDIDAFKRYAEDLRKLNVTEQMRIIVQAITNAVQMEKTDPIARLADRLALSNQNMKSLEEIIIKEHANLKETVSSLEIVKKEIKTTISTATNLLKKDKEMEKVMSIIEKNEHALREAKKKLISRAKTINKLDNELTNKQKDLSEVQILNLDTITGWRKALKICKKESVVFKKQHGRITELVAEYGKDTIKYNMNYGMNIKELDDLDDKLQSLRGDIINNGKEVLTKKVNYKFRISLVTLGSNIYLSQLLTNIFIFNEVPEVNTYNGDYKESKGYSVNIELGKFKIDYCIYNLRSLEESCIKNSEAVLLLYDLNETDNLEKVKSAVEFLDKKTEAIVVLSGISKENAKLEVNVRNYAIAKGIPIKATNITSNTEVQELFFGVLYAIYPELYESIK